MFRRSFLFFTIVVIALLAAHSSVYAQTAPLNGFVTVEKDGKAEPVAGAQVDVYRTDIKGFYHMKTDKKGEFRFVGILYGEYVIAVSAPNCAPAIYPGVRAGQEGLKIVLVPGDGRKYTEAEAKKGGAEASKSGGASEMSDEERRQRAELEKKNAEIDAKNKKIQNADAIAAKSNTEGNTALNAGNFELAIAKYTEGIEAVPDFVGSTPIMLTGKILALKGKGFKTYKEGATSGDSAIRTAKIAEANKLYDDALAAFQQAQAVIKAAETATDPAEQKRREKTSLKLYEAATDVHRLKAGIDQSKIGDAGTMFAEYIALLTDPAAKIDAQMALGETMRRGFDFAKAVEAYRQVLVTKPDHAEAMGWLGLSLFGLATSTEPSNKDMEQEGLNYMQKYTELAPVSATDTAAVRELKESIKQTVDYLKAEKKMTPQKVPSQPKKKN